MLTLGQSAIDKQHVANHLGGMPAREKKDRHVFMGIQVDRCHNEAIVLVKIARRQYTISAQYISPVGTLPGIHLGISCNTIHHGQ